MERTKNSKSIKKIFNRGLSYIILLFGVFAICYSTKKIVDFSIAKKENKQLQQQLTKLKEENKKLETINDKLKDKDYFSVYVNDKYQYSPSDNTITPIK